MHPKLFCSVPADIALRFRHEILDFKANLELGFPAAAIDRLSSLHPDLEELRCLLKENGLRCTAHAPFDDLAPGGFDSRFRSLTRKRLHQFLSIARRLSPDLIVLHTGYDARIFEYRRNAWTVHAAGTFRSVLGELPDNDVDLVVENVFEPHAGILLDLLELVDDPRMGICLDFAHAVLWSDVSVQNWIESAASKLRHIHVSDHHGARDDHLGLGEGSLPYPEFLSELERINVQPSFTIEANGLDSISRSIDFLAQHGWPR